MAGRVIAVTGGPRTGKSTLVRLLSDRLGARAFLEGEEKDFPPRILDDLKKGGRMLELLVWFRNKNVADYLKALDIRAAGGIAILDTFWATNDVYTDEWAQDDFEKQILKDLASIDSAFLPWPDLVLSLQSAKEKIKEFSAVGGREFEQNEAFLQKQVDLNNAHETYFKALGKPNIRFVNLAEFNALDERDLNSLINDINSRLGL